MNFVWLAVFCVSSLHSCARAYGRPELPIEPCPEDSVAIEGVCKCDHSLCDKPRCATTLTLATNGTSTPGNCCPTYSCEGCPEEDQIDGKCPCLPGATLLSGRRCECVDPHKTLVNDTCECDPDKCELPGLCDDRSIQLTYVNGCCERVNCKRCPEDSFPTNYNSVEVPDLCVCNVCPPTKCNEHQRVQIQRRGRNVAGTCCDIYTCEDMDPNKGCVVNGTTYSDGETWNSQGDDKCKCQKGISFCSPMSEIDSFRSCLSGGKVYKHLDTWVEDTCTNCTCKDGEPKCIAHMCDVHTSEVKKPTDAKGCPPLVTCKRACENGYKLNRQGCETCKCKQSDKVVILQEKYTHLDALLKEHNLTEADVVLLVKDLTREGAQLVDVPEASTIAPDVMTTVSTTTSSAASPTTSTTTSATTTTTTSTAAPSSPIYITDSKNAHGDCTYSCILEYAFPGFAVGVIFTGILLFCFLKCSEKNRQKYQMAYTYKPVGKEAVDRNLNFSPIIKTKHLELQSYNENKNVY